MWPYKIILGNAPRGALITYAYRGIILRNFLGTQNVSSASLQPKNFTYFYALTPVNEHENPETMPFEARIASTEPRNISLTIFHVQKTSCLCYDFRYFGPKNITLERFKLPRNIGLTSLYVLFLSTPPPPGQVPLLLKCC